MTIYSFKEKGWVFVSDKTQLMKLTINKILITIIFLGLSLNSNSSSIFEDLKIDNGQNAMQNVLNRNKKSLNGKWNVLVDPMNIGIKKHWGVLKLPKDKSTLYELRFEGGMMLNVPGDWNSQRPQFEYYEGAMWYKKDFYIKKQKDKRTFIHFGAVCMHSIVYLNGKEIGKHSGGWSPFQYEITDKIKEGKNYVIVRVDNVRSINTIPCMNFDWWNYGGITRDVDIITTPKTFIQDYWIRLKKGDKSKILVDILLNGKDKANQEIKLSIPDAKIHKKLKTNQKGIATLAITAKHLKLWETKEPFLYNIELSSKLDKINDKIGFRDFQVKGSNIYLNDKSIFLRGINIHEEIAMYKRRSVNKEDAEYLTNQAKDLHCNFIRLSHYPQNEYMIRLCEEKGFMMWEEIPLWQGINFSNPSVCKLARNMMKEMICRDKNRCGIVMWSIANETFASNQARCKYLIQTAKAVKSWDNTRALTSALNGIHLKKTENGYENQLIDPLKEYLDIVSLNKYMGWYNKWPCPPEDLKWVISNDKPIIFSEFGAGAVYGIQGDTTDINKWTEGYQAQTYKNDIKSFETIPNYRGSNPWILFDFRSPRRANAQYQQGWNRKGLISPNGDRKEAWYIMRKYYKNKENF